MRLYLLRHSEAEISGNISDSDRKLTSAGVEEAQAAAKAIAAMKLSFTVGLTSPMTRARQTMEIVTKQFQSLSVKSINQLSSTADPKEFFAELQALPRDSRVLVVSHEPFISRCVGKLINADEDPHLSIKKGTLVCVEVGSPVQRGAGVLLWVLTNEQMRLMFR